MAFDTITALQAESFINYLQHSGINQRAVTAKSMNGIHLGQSVYTADMDMGTVQLLHMHLQALPG